MTEILPQCQNLRENVEKIKELSIETFPSVDISDVETALEKALSPTFEIVFAGAFSAGKSMLINALLGRKLLYSAVGHATGTVCYIKYAKPPEEEKAKLTFLSETEIQERVGNLYEKVFKRKPVVTKGFIDINDTPIIEEWLKSLESILSQGSKDSPERWKQANALSLLLKGWKENQTRILNKENATWSIPFKKADDFAKHGDNSSIIKQIEYWCHHELLKDGAVIVDTPGIDAPVAIDAGIAFKMIDRPQTSAVVCVFKTADTGEITTEEDKLIQRTQDNPMIRDRVFNIFNLIDFNWYDSERKKKLNQIINDQFPKAQMCKTSGLLGFYGGLLKAEGMPENDWGLKTFLAEGTIGDDGKEEAPSFVQEFNRYCLSGKLPTIDFPIPPEVLTTDNPNLKYCLILNAHGYRLIDKLIADSGIEKFRSEITNYLTKKARPQLFETLAEYLQPLCINLRKYYLKKQQDLVSQPDDIESIVKLGLLGINQQLKSIGDELCNHIKTEVVEVINGENLGFNKDFHNLQNRMVIEFTERLNTFSIEIAHKQALVSHPGHAVVPLLAILTEALYYLTYHLKEVLVESSKSIVANFFQGLILRVHKQQYYGNLGNLLEDEGNIDRELKQIKENTIKSLVNAANVECDRYLREGKGFFDEGDFSKWKILEILKKVAIAFDFKGMKETESEIKKLLELDFSPKISQTINRDFLATIHITLNEYLSQKATAKIADDILGMLDIALAKQEKKLRDGAEIQIAVTKQMLIDCTKKIQEYNRAVESINSCLEAMELDHKMPQIPQ
jgi:hypothetical protein